MWAENAQGRMWYPIILMQTYREIKATKETCCGIENGD